MSDGSEDYSLIINGKGKEDGDSWKVIQHIYRAMNFRAPFMVLKHPFLAEDKKMVDPDNVSY